MSRTEPTEADLKWTNPLVLAFLGDATYSHCVRRHLIGRGLVKPRHLHQEASRYVSAKAQAHILHALMPMLTEEELEVVRRGRNAKSGSVAKNADVIDYRHATAFEALIGFLDLSGRRERLANIMEEAFAVVEGRRSE